MSIMMTPITMAPSRMAEGMACPPAHPNEIDLLRITRALGARARYRYVQPEVSTVPSGYLVRSPCCSRRPDPDGGVIDVARLVWHGDDPCWLLYRKDHAEDRWIEDSSFVRLADALARLNADPEHLFWP